MIDSAKIDKMIEAPTTALPPRAASRPKSAAVVEVPAARGYSRDHEDGRQPIGYGFACESPAIQRPI